MNRQEEQTKLVNAITVLKEDLDATDLNALSQPEEIEQYIDRIGSVYVQIKQYVSRFDINDWKSWGPALWNDIERNDAALRRKLVTIERQESKKVQRLNKRFMYLSAFFAAMSAFAALISAFWLMYVPN